MRVILVGDADERAQLRARINGTAIDVIGEFGTLAQARAAALEADAVLTLPDVSSGSSHAPSGSDAASGFSRKALSGERDDDDTDGPESLTPREIQVLELLAEGLSNKAIAARLGISDQTVKFHVASLSGKLGASNRTDAVRRGVRRGLITL